MEGFHSGECSSDNVFYEKSMLQRPEEMKSGGGRGKYCCVPQCGNASRDRHGNYSSIGMFKFPNKEKKPVLRKKWKSWINNYRRPGGTDKFKVTDSTYVCEFHFNVSDINVSFNTHRKTLKRDAVPSILNASKKILHPERKKPALREAPPSQDSFIEQKGLTLEPSDVTDTQDDNNFSCESDFTDCENCDNFVIQLNFYREQAILLNQQNEKLSEENESLRRRIFTYDNIRSDKEMFRHVTGLELENFDILYEYLNPGEHCENVKFHEPTRKHNDSQRSDFDSNSPSFLSPESKPGPRPKLTGIEQLFLFLIWLRLGLTLKHTGWLFGLKKSTVSRYIITWANFMYFKLGCIPIWPTKEKIKSTMPDCFKKTFPNTRVIIDCTELFCQRPTSLTIQSSLFSHYKHHVTYKGLVGIAPSGAITFISGLYDGSISDVEIVRRCGLLEKKFWDDGDDVMADRGFTIKNLLEPLNVTLNIPSFLAGKDQLTEEEALGSQTIASVRIHVERAIQRIKRFRQIRNEIPLTLNGSINQIWTVACMLCNFMPPLLKQ